VFGHTTVSAAHACFAWVSEVYFAKVRVVGWPVAAAVPVLVGVWSVPDGGGVVGEAAVGACALATPAVVRNHIKAIAPARRPVLLLGHMVTRILRYARPRLHNRRSRDRGEPSGQHCVSLSCATLPRMSMRNVPRPACGGT
jgi:hypothetical protein